MGEVLYRAEEAPLQEPQSLRLTYVGPWRVSTVDLRHPGNPLGAFVNAFDALMGEKHRFETMVFRGEGYTELDRGRYDSKDAALAGHDAMVERWSRRATAEVPNG